MTTIGISALGIQYLSTANQMFIQQESYTCFPKHNKDFSVLNLNMQELFSINENSKWYGIFQCCRKAEFRMSDGQDNVVLQIISRYKCRGRTAEVYIPPGHLVGEVEKRWNFYRAKLDVKKADGNVFLKIRGPVYVQTIFSPIIEYEILSISGEKVGKITKIWSGFLRERILHLHFYSIVFPNNAEIETRAILLAACLLIDFLNVGGN